MFHSWFWIRQNLNYVDIKWNIYHRYCLVQTSKIVFHWFIVQDNKNPISSRSYSYEPITKIQISQDIYHVLVNLLLIKSILIFVCMQCDNLKIPYHNRWYFHCEFKKGVKILRCSSLASGKLRTHRSWK